MQITLEAMKSDNNDVALQGIEFWSTVCDEEQDLSIEAAEVIMIQRYNMSWSLYNCIDDVWLLTGSGGW